MFYNLPLCVERKPSDLLYLICNGNVIGNNPKQLDNTLNMMGLTDHRCTVHLIFKIPNNAYSYTHSDLLASHNALYSPIDDKTSSSDAMRALQDIYSNSETTILQSVSNLSSILREVGSQPDSYCSVCNDSMENNLVELNCGHIFHRECIEAWLTTTSVHCPMCDYDTREN